MDRRTTPVKRDRQFHNQMLAAYNRHCARTGRAIRVDLRNTPYWSRIAVEAIPLRLVTGSHSGSDDIHHGLPMLRTLHGLFGHGLLSAEPMGQILASPLLALQVDEAPVFGLLRCQEGTSPLLGPFHPAAAPRAALVR